MDPKMDPVLSYTTRIYQLAFEKYEVFCKVWGTFPDSKGSQMDPKMEPEWIPKWTQNGPQNGPKMDPKWSQKGVHLGTRFIIYH